ncbi:hypothetical protein M0D21_17090 [Aquimarina sp. D1M17]|uniref:hypothetical protein n=1 Tax=Aquimarina acroporae TaxID=2937283 RepID=UPI0020C0A484|nr:hypothetical protein [Aquimarina acroporae]MCK8523299.1 hypothetical protein [Aquimarina acroporae]
MLKEILLFLFLFVVIVIGGYFIHTEIIKSFSLDRNDKIIDLSYLFNGAFTIVFTVGTLLVRKRFKDLIGFIFMGGSLIKIGGFIAITKFNDIEINKNVFLDFFIAYLICLILEVYYFSRILKSIN